jgi:hypothetical protein
MVFANPTYATPTLKCYVILVWAVHYSLAGVFYSACVKCVGDKRVFSCNALDLPLCYASQSSRKISTSYCRPFEVFSVRFIAYQPLSTKGPDEPHPYAP